MANRVNALQPVLLLAVLGLTACTNESISPAGPEQHDTQSVELDKAELVHAQLKIGSGDLDVQGGAAKLLNADFTYNVAAWKPDLRYTAGDLVIEQHGSTTFGGGSKNHWDLRFNDTVPLELKVDFGAGDAKLNLGTLNLRGLNFQIGAGKLRLDLRGTPTHDYSVHIQGGVGESVVYLPKQVGISATASSGIGGISVTGLSKNGGRYENDALKTAKVRINLDVQGGVGSIKLIAD